MEDAEAAKVSLHHLRKKKYRDLLSSINPLVIFYAFAATIAGVLSPLAQALIRIRVRERAAINNFPDRQLAPNLAIHISATINE